jgi:hypothetical protein
MQTASAADIQHMVDTCCMAPRALSVGVGEDGLEGLLEVLATPTVSRREDRDVSLADILQWIVMPECVAKEVDESTPTAPSYESWLWYDAVADMEECCANTAQPGVAVDAANAPDAKVYCKVDRSCLQKINIRRDWMIDTLMCRPELCASVYPPLTESESESAKVMSGFIDNDSGGAADDHVLLSWD